MKAKQFLSLGLLLLILPLAGCAEKASSADTSSSSAQMAESPSETTFNDNETVIIAMPPTSEPASGFDPAFGWGAGEHVHEPLIQSTLTVTTEDLQIANDLATTVSVSEDGLVWTVTIREGVFFSDKTPLTAEDVAFTYETVKQESSVNDFTMLKRVEAVDSTTVKFYMNKPYSIWPYTMAIVGIVPKQTYGPDYGQQPIGSGRYLLKQWDKGQQIILEANPDYYGDEILMKKVVFVFLDEASAFAAAKSGQVDLAYTAASYSDQTINGYELLDYETVDNRGMNLPAVADNGAVGSQVTSDPALRQAINIGLNREEMIQNVLNGYGTPAYSVCDKMPWFNPDTTLVYDRDKAITLLEEAGWFPAENGIRIKNGVPASFSLLYPMDDSVRQALAADAANQLLTLGILATPEGVGWDTAYERAQKEPLIWGWGAHTPMELYNIYHTMPETGLAEYSPYQNSSVDTYMDEALLSTDLAASYELWQNAQWDGTTGTSADASWIWLVNIDHLYWSRSNLKVADQKLHPHGHGWSIVNNVDQWTYQDN